MNIEQVAQICHMANKSYCFSIGDRSQQPWDEAPDWQKQSAINGVKFTLRTLEKGEEPSPAASHESWLEEKRQAGWSYGRVKDQVAKEHPCFVPYSELPLEQRLKDYIFIGIVKAFWLAEHPV